MHQEGSPCKPFLYPPLSALSLVGMVGDYSPMGKKIHCPNMAFKLKGGWLEKYAAVIPEGPLFQQLVA